MPKDRQTVHDRVLEQYDVLHGFRPEKPQDVALADSDKVDELVERLRSTLGITEPGELPDGTLDDLIDYLHERWDGETLDALEQG